MQKSSPCFTSLWFALILMGMRSLQKPEKPLARDSVKLMKRTLTSSMHETEENQNTKRKNRTRRPI